MAPRHAEVVTVRPDSKGRIALGKFARGVSSFQVHQDRDGRIVLEPFAEVPARERWLFENREALESVKRGLSQTHAGRVKKAGSFAKYADEPLE